MKTSHIVAIAAVVIIGLIFFFSGSSDPSSDSQVAPADTQGVENTDNSNDELQDTESQPQDTESDNTLLESDTELDASLETTSQTGSDSEPTEHVFTLDSFAFGYSLEGNRVEQIRVEQGDTVTINLTNSEGYHDWVVDEFDAATEKINVGETTSVTFVADEAGTFEYYCSVGNHREQGMVGTLVVE